MPATSHAVPDSRRSFQETDSARALSDGSVRVAMVIQRFRPSFSGQGEQLELLCQVLARRGFEPTIITRGHEGSASEEQLDGYRVVRLRPDRPRGVAFGRDSGAFGPAFASRTFGYLSAQPAFDLVHVHALTDALYASWLWCRWHRKPLLFEMTLMGADDPVSVMDSRNRLASLRRALFRRCDGYVAISPALEQRYREAGFPQDKVRVVAQGVDVGRFLHVADRASLRRQLNLPAAGPLLIFVGSLIHRKGIDVLLRAWQDIHAAWPGAHLLLAGRNRFDDDTEATAFLAGRLALLPAGAADHVRQLGVRDDVDQLLQAADLFVFPSRREGFGTVMIEAMACGLPCIVTELPGITDFIFGDDGEAGTVVAQEDHRAIVSAVHNTLADPARATRIGRRARTRVVDHFDIERIADRYVAYYTDLLAGMGPGRV